MKSGPGGSSASLYSYSPQSSPVTKTFEEAAAAASKDGRLARHTSADYERIRVVGKGSFGMAVLYRRRDDDSFVILKEINLHELNPSERQMSLNEVRLLSRLDHPHIIAFYDSFEEEGTLMIEMEYADGGTLAQFLGRQSELLAEAQAMDMFEQMVSAVSYLHDNSILHRDLKTANIFLTKELMVKIGDFGISKKMGTETKFQGAQTILGTPYYLSPEMCEGRSYNEKSDIWALGCCLYEMSALKKAFDADNLPTLIHKIINSEYEPLSPKGPYSQELRILIRDLLKTDPEQRPAAASVLEQVRRFRSLASAKDPLLGGPAPKGKPCPGGGCQFGQSPVDSYSALYGFDVFNVTLSAVQEFPARIQIQQFAVSPTHQLLLTADSRVYSWGDNRFGQLGHGDRKKRLVPTVVQALEAKGVSRVAAGKHFSLFCAGRGIVMAAGHRQLVGTGPIGEDQTKPKIVDALLKEDIVDICCGDEHAAVLTESGGVFVWGRGANGRLGTGDCKDVFVPTQIQIPTRQLINSLVCGPDATMLITNSGTVLAMGSNKYNKLNLNQRSGFFKDVKGKEPQQQQQQQPHFGGPMEVEDVLLPSAIKPFPSRVVSASLGAEHSGVLLENGHVHMFGLNSSGQLGTGNILPCQSSYTRPVKALLSKACLHLICGDGFTAAATVDNELYFWGVRGGGGGGGEQQSGGGPTAENNAHLAEMPPAAATGAKVYQMAKTREGWQLSAPNPTHQAAVLQPTLVLRLDICRAPAGLNSLNSCARGLSAASKPFIGLAGLVCSAKRVFCVVDVAKEQLPKAKEETDTLIRDNQHMGEGKRRHRRRRSAPDALSVKSMDTWIKEELNSAEYIPYNQQQPMPIDRTQQQQQQQQDSSSSSSMLLQSERKLRAEIELLRGQLQEQKSTFRGHQKQMAQLQGKLADLQHLLRRNHGLLALPPVNIPPPAYPGVVEQKTTNAEKRPSVLRNTFLPSQQDGPPATRACTIL